MPVERTAALVIGSVPLGESDRIVTFFTRSFGKVRGVARAARRVRSRFTGALQLFTLGELVFFDSGRTDLVQIDHFDVVRPFQTVREDLERLAHAAWIAECVSRLTADRDANPALFALVTRALASIETGTPAPRAAVVFGAHCVDLLGHRLRIDACVACGRPLARAVVVALDVDGGGTVCAACDAALGGVIRIASAALQALARVRAMPWDDAIDARVDPFASDLRALLDAHVSALAGRGSRATRFLREVSRAFPVSEAP